MGEFDKISIAQGQFPGNLMTRMQRYAINYMPPDGEYTPKLELAIIMTSPNGSSKDEYRSIRFTNTAQIKAFIIAMCKGYFIFAKQIKEITTANFRYRFNKFQKELEAALIQSMQ